MIYLLGSLNLIGLVVLFVLIWVIRCDLQKPEKFEKKAHDAVLSRLDEHLLEARKSHWMAKKNPRNKVFIMSLAQAASYCKTQWGYGAVGEQLEKAKEHDEIADCKILFNSIKFKRFGLRLRV